MTQMPKKNYEKKVREEEPKIEKFYEDKGMPSKKAEQVAKSTESPKKRGTHT